MGPLQPYLPLCIADPAPPTEDYPSNTHFKDQLISVEIEVQGHKIWTYLKRLWTTFEHGNGLFIDCLLYWAGEIA